MTARALHMRRERQHGEGLDLRFSLCGMVAVEVTDSTVEVTCRLCRRALAVAPTLPPVEPEVLGVELPAVRGAHELTDVQVAIVERSLAVGTDETPRSRFRSLAALWRMYACVMDDGSPVRSSSDTDRFGARVQQSGGAVRMPSGRDDMIEVDAALAHATTAPLVVGPHTFTGAQQRAIYLARSIGRPLVGRIAPDRKGLATTRASLSEAQIAERLEDGEVVTERHVRLVIRGVNARMVPVLVAKGILPARALPEETGEMKIPGYDIEGWKAIADALGVSEPQARRYADSYALPVVRTTQGKVHASSAALRTWAQQQVRAS